MSAEQGLKASSSFYLAFLWILILSSLSFYDTHWRLYCTADEAFVFYVDSWVCFGRVGVIFYFIETVLLVSDQMLAQVGLYVNNTELIL